MRRTVYALMTYVTKLIASETDKANFEWYALFYCHVLNLFHSVYTGRTYAHTWLMTNALYASVWYAGNHKRFPAENVALEAYISRKFEEAKYLLKHFKTTGHQADAFRKIIKFGELSQKNALCPNPLCDTLIAKLEDELPYYLLNHNITKQKGFKVAEAANAVCFFLNQIKAVKPETAIIGALVKAIGSKRHVVFPPMSVHEKFTQAVDIGENITTQAMKLPDTDAFKCIKELTNIYIGETVC